MNFNVYFAAGGLEWCYISVFHKTFDNLKKMYPEHSFNFINNFGMKREGDSCNAKYGDVYMIIENPENKKYSIVSYWDAIRNVTHHYSVTNWDIENCVNILTTSGTQLEEVFYTQIDYPFIPISYVCMSAFCENVISKIDHSKPKNKVNKLSFRGYLYEFRKFISEDNRFDIVDKTKDMLDIENYIHELSSNNINLSLNGAAEICNRDIEILGTGTALFRPQLNCKFHNLLIPDYHYISVDTSDIQKETHFQNYYKHLADRMYDKFEKIKNDEEFIKFISENGKKWYEENGTVEKNAEIVANVINLENLK